jgi:putative solute:sodium symporter small subunit
MNDFPDKDLHNPPKQTAYWRKTRRLTLQLLLAWFLVTFGSIFFARELSSLVVFGWPFPFYIAAQGAILVYVLIVAVYAWRMQRLDKIIGKGDGADGQ